jgi:hypothetical protein
MGIGRGCLATARVLLYKTWGILECPVPKMGYFALQVAHRGQQLTDSSGRWVQTLVLGRDSQVLQGEGLPHRPRGPAPQTTPGFGAWLCTPIKRHKAHSEAAVRAGDICGWGHLPQAVGQASPLSKAILEVGTGGPTEVQVTLLHSGLSGLSPGPPSPWVHIALLQEA